MPVHEAKLIGPFGVQSVSHASERIIRQEHVAALRRMS